MYNETRQGTSVTGSRSIARGRRCEARGPGACLRKENRETIYEASGAMGQNVQNKQTQNRPLDVWPGFRIRRLEMSVCLFTLQALCSSSGHTPEFQRAGWKRGRPGKEEGLAQPVPLWGSALFEGRLCWRGSRGVQTLQPSCLGGTAALPLTSQVTCSPCLNLSMPQFPHLQNEGTLSTCLRDGQEDKMSVHQHNVSRRSLASVDRSIVGHLSSLANSSTWQKRNPNWMCWGAVTCRVECVKYELHGHCQKGSIGQKEGRRVPAKMMPALAGPPAVPRGVVWGAQVVLRSGNHLESPVCLLPTPREVEGSLGAGGGGL